MTEGIKTELRKSRSTGYGDDHDVLRAAYRWQQARMAMVKADVKADNHELWKELGRAEDALSRAVLTYEGMQ
jgi:hypothetical protein